MTKTEKLLRELIALPSVNPAFVPAGEPRAGEQRVGEFLAATATRAGLETQFQTVLPGRNNLIARLTPAGKVQHRIVLAPHLDTVNGTSSQFTPQKRNGRTYGRGACDAKGCVAAMMMALCEFAEKKPKRLTTEILFAGLVDEEHAQAGSYAFAASGCRADLAIVGEPTQGKVVTAHKGSMWLELQTHGKSAHGARPELGTNAIHEMARIVDWLETEYAARLRRRRHRLLRHPTVSVGVIRGGTQPNIVPDQCAISVDRRTLPGETEASVRREILRALRQKGLRAILRQGKLAPCLPLETNARLPMIARFLDILGQKKPSGVDYFCDASVLGHAGTPSIVFGPGDIAYAHTLAEWISLKSLEQARAALLRYFQMLP